LKWPLWSSTVSKAAPGHVWQLSELAESGVAADFGSGGGGVTVVWAWIERTERLERSSGGREWNDIGRLKMLGVAIVDDPLSAQEMMLIMEILANRSEWSSLPDSFAQSIQIIINVRLRASSV